jgi:hypothetical protein
VGGAGNGKLTNIAVASELATRGSGGEKDHANLSVLCINGFLFFTNDRRAAVNELLPQDGALSS